MTPPGVHVSQASASTVQRQGTPSLALLQPQSTNTQTPVDTKFYPHKCGESTWSQGGLDFVTRGGVQCVVCAYVARTHQAAEPLLWTSDAASGVLYENVHARRNQREPGLGHRKPQCHEVEMNLLGRTAKVVTISSHKCAENLRKEIALRTHENTD